MACQEKRRARVFIVIWFHQAKLHSNAKIAKINGAGSSLFFFFL